MAQWLRGVGWGAGGAVTGTCLCLVRGLGSAGGTSAPVRGGGPGGQEAGGGASDMVEGVNMTA